MKTSTKKFVLGIVLAGTPILVLFTALAITVPYGALLLAGAFVVAAMIVKGIKMAVEGWYGY